MGEGGGEGEDRVEEREWERVGGIGYGREFGRASARGVGERKWEWVAERLWKTWSPGKIIILGTKKRSPNQFFNLTPPPYPGREGLGGVTTFCVLRPLCVDLDAGPEQLFLYMEPQTDEGGSRRRGGSRGVCHGETGRVEVSQSRVGGCQRGAVGVSEAATRRHARRWPSSS